jgi:hypothetical protein
VEHLERELPDALVRDSVTKAAEAVGASGA